MAFYTPLDHRENEIRLLRVDLSDAAQHELVSNVALRSKRQQYQALSYTWGDKRNQILISISNQDFPISQSLYQALESVRAFWRKTYSTDGKPLLLWCDQICIDQSSNEEKSRQVAYMSEIYRRAEEVLIWLPVPASVSSGFNDWSHWKRWHEHQITASDAVLQAAYSSPNQMEYAFGQQRSSQSLVAAWDNIRRVVESPWWSRAWVYQEFVLATRATFLIAGLVAPWFELQEVLAHSSSRMQAHGDALQTAQVNVNQKADELDLLAREQLREPKYSFETTPAEEDGCAPTWHAWHDYYAQYLTLDPFREGSLAFWVYKNARKQGTREPGTGGVVHNVRVLAAVAFVSFWAPFAFVQYVLVVICTPVIWAVTSWPKPQNTTEQLARERGLRVHQAEQARRNVTEMRLLSNERLGPLGTSFESMPRSWKAVESILSSKAEMVEGKFRPLSQLMRQARNGQCHDQRDKIFAFLGLVDPAYGIVANYHPDNTLHDVVTRATAAVITTEASLNILNDAKEDSGISKAVDHLPSWVPNFTTPDRANVQYEKFIQGIQLPSSGLSASGRTSAETSFFPDRHGNPERVLRARGVRVGRLTSIIQDPAYEPWRVFADDSGRTVATRNDARPGDEVWVLLGADVPFTLTMPGAAQRDESYQILGQAMIREAGGAPSRVMYGSLIDLLAKGEVSAEDISLI